MLDEVAKRKPEFDERNSAPIRLADGQSWYFGKPWVEIHASFDGGKARATWPVITCGPELDVLIEALGSCENDGTLLIMAASLGAHLLSRNYELDDRELDMLFAFRPMDSDSWTWVNSVLEVATGQSGCRDFPDGNA